MRLLMEHQRLREMPLELLMLRPNKSGFGQKRPCEQVESRRSSWPPRNALRGFLQRQ